MTAGHVFRKHSRDSSSYARSLDSEVGKKADVPKVGRRERPEFGQERTGSVSPLGCSNFVINKYINIETHETRHGKKIGSAAALSSLRAISFGVPVRGDHDRHL